MLTKWPTNISSSFIREIKNTNSFQVHLYVNSGILSVETVSQTLLLLKLGSKVAVKEVDQKSLK